MMVVDVSVRRRTRRRGVGHVELGGGDRLHPSHRRCCHLEINKKIGILKPQGKFRFTVIIAGVVVVVVVVGDGGSRGSGER